MSNKKVIVIDEEIDKALGNICDAALRGSGMQIVGAVNTLIESVVEEHNPID